MTPNGPPPRVDVLVLPGGTPAARESTVASALAQRDVAVEIVEMADEPLDDRLRAEFIAPVRAGDHFAPHKLRLQTRALAESSHDLALGPVRRVTPTGVLIDEWRPEAWTALEPLIAYRLPPAASIVVRRTAWASRLETDPTARADDPFVSAAVLAARHGATVVDAAVADVVVEPGRDPLEPIEWIRDILPLIRDQVLRSAPHASVLRRDILARLYLDVAARLWREFRGIDLWGFGDSHSPNRAEAHVSELHDVEANREAIAEREAVIEDLQWTLDRQVEQFAALNVTWAQRIDEADRVGEFPDQALSKRDETITWLHTEVANRDEIIVSIQGEIADRDARLVEYHEMVMAHRAELEALRQRDRSTLVRRNMRRLVPPGVWQRLRGRQPDGGEAGGTSGRDADS